MIGPMEREYHKSLGKSAGYVDRWCFSYPYNDKDEKPCVPMSGRILDGKTDLRMDLQFALFSYYGVYVGMYLKSIRRNLSHQNPTTGNTEYMRVSWSQKLFYAFLY